MTQSLTRLLEEAELSTWSSFLEGLQEGGYETSVTTFDNTHALRAESVRSQLMNRVKNFSNTDLHHFDSIIDHYREKKIDFSFDIVPDFVTDTNEFYKPFHRVQASPLVHYTQHIIDLQKFDSKLEIDQNFTIVKAETSEKFADTFARGFGLNRKQRKKRIPLQTYGWGHRNFQCFVLKDGKEDHPVATGVLHPTSSKIGVLCGATTVPDFRGKGYQQALIQFRLQHAKEIGMKYVISDAVAGSSSSRNLQRSGFNVAYTRTYWNIKFDQ